MGSLSMRIDGKYKYPSLLIRCWLQNFHQLGLKNNKNILHQLGLKSNKKYPSACYEEQREVPPQVGPEQQTEMPQPAEPEQHLQNTPPVEPAHQLELPSDSMIPVVDPEEDDVFEAVAPYAFQGLVPEEIPMTDQSLTHFQWRTESSICFQKITESVIFCQCASMFLYMNHKGIKFA